MIISGSGLNLTSVIHILNERTLDTLRYRGQSLVGLALSRRLTRISGSDCLVELDYGNKTCSFNSGHFNRYTIDVCVVNSKGHIVHNERACYILAKHGDAYVDCWNVGGDTGVVATLRDEATFDVSVLTVEHFTAHEYFSDMEDSFLEEIIDEIKECGSHPEICGPVGCPCRQSAEFVASK